MRTLILTAAISAGIALSDMHAQGDDYRPRVNQPHADFTLPSVVDGSPVALSHFRGRKVLLIHFASW
jgi:hypothetical protein